MYSFLTTYLDSLSEKLLFYFNKYNISTDKIVLYSLLLNAFAVLNLINDQFFVFILLFLNSYFFLHLAKINQMKRNDTTRLSRFLSRFAIWLMLFTVGYAVYNMYHKYFTAPFLGIMLFISIMCNINYSLKTLNKVDVKEYEDRGDLKSIVVKKWSQMFGYMSKEDRDKTLKMTRYFDESMFIVYFIIAMIYLEFLRQENIKNIIVI